MQDAKVCPICRALEGYTWFFNTGDHALNGRLDHPLYGVVWTTELGSQAHGHRGHCRCHLDYEIDVKDILQKITQIEKDLETKLV
jgi:hypothetical protein